MTGEISLLPFTFEAADPTLGPIGAWFAPALGRTLPPVIWRGALDDGPGLDELAPASTARPWLVAELVDLRPPRRMNFGPFLGMLMALAFTGPSSPETARMVHHLENEAQGGNVSSEGDHDAND